MVTQPPMVSKCNFDFHQNPVVIKIQLGSLMSAKFSNRYLSIPEFGETVPFGRSRVGVDYQTWFVLPVSDILFWPYPLCFKTNEFLHNLKSSESFLCTAGSIQTVVNRILTTSQSCVMSHEMDKQYITVH